MKVQRENWTNERGGKQVCGGKIMRRGQRNKELGPCKELGQPPHPRHLLSWQNKGRQPPKCGALAL